MGTEIQKAGDVEQGQMPPNAVVGAGVLARLAGGIIPLAGLTISPEPQVIAQRAAQDGFAVAPKPNPAPAPDHAPQSPVMEFLTPGRPAP